MNHTTSEKLNFSRLATQKPRNRITIALPDQLYELLQSAANEAKMTISAFLREAIVDKLQEK